MKIASHIHRAVTLPVLSVSALLLMATAQTSKAAITVTFEETGGNVVATISGSLDLSGLTVNLPDYAFSRGVGVATTSRLLQIGNTDDGGTSDRYQGAEYVESGISMTFSSHTVSESFGYTEGQLWVPGATPTNATDYTPAAGMSFTWESETLAGIGLGSLTDTPLTVWNNPNATGTDGSIQYVGPAVPEPSSLLLLGLASLGFVSRRKR